MVAYSFISHYLWLIDWGVAKEVLMRRPKVFRRDERFNKWAKDAGLEAGIISLEGEDWSRMRQLVSPSFSRQSITRMSDLIFHEAKVFTQGLLDRMRFEIGDGPMPLRVDGIPTLQRYTLSVICRLAFGSAVDGVDYLRGEGITQDTNALFTWMYRRTVTLLPNWFWHIYQDDVERNASRAIRRLDAVVSDILTNYREASHRTRGQEAEFLRTLDDSSKSTTDMNAETKTKPLTDLEVAAQIKGFIVAGTETTSTLIAATLWQLCLPQNAHLVEDLRNEIASILGEDKCVRTQAQWDQLQIVQATLKETNRLYGPSPIIGVQATTVDQEDDTKQAEAATAAVADMLQQQKRFTDSANIYVSISTKVVFLHIDSFSTTLRCPSLCWQSLVLLFVLLVCVLLVDESGISWISGRRMEDHQSQQDILLGQLLIHIKI